MKKLRHTKEWHTANTKNGSGDYYGTGIKQKQGRVRDNYMGNFTMSDEKLKTPPRSLA